MEVLDSCRSDIGRDAISLPYFLPFFRSPFQVSWIIFTMHSLHLTVPVVELMSPLFCTRFVFQTASPSPVASSGRKRYCNLSSELGSCRVRSRHFSYWGNGCQIALGTHKLLKMVPLRLLEREPITHWHGVTSQKNGVLRYTIANTWKLAACNSWSFWRIFMRLFPFRFIWSKYRVKLLCDFHRRRV